MEALGLTPEQAAIVAERGRDVFVTAGAGSGKTRVLVERYVALLEESRIPEIAAVTFTDAAATEMRERVRRTVLTRPDLERHRVDLDDAMIGTIHSLCRRILREHPVEAGIDPLARVLAEDEAEFELIVASIDALEAAAEADDGRALALREVGVYALSEQLPRLVARRDEVRSAFDSLPGNTPPQWAEHVRARLDAGLREAVDAARPSLVVLVESLRGAYTGPAEDALFPRWQDLLKYVGDPAEGDALDLFARLQAAASAIDLRGGSKANWHDVAATKAAMREVREVAKALDVYPRWNEHDELALQALVALRAVFEDACGRYAARKRELVALDYLDLEIEAARMLAAHPGVAASYQARFRHLMVDEFQDTNPAQVTVLELLSGDMDSEAPRPELFLVGDAKQAIYRFRGSDVRHFRRFHRKIEAAQGVAYSLTRCFRTHDALVEIVNSLFASVFGDAVEEFEAPMQAMTGRSAAVRVPPHLTLMPIAARTPEGERAGGHERRRVEADAVASNIAAIIGEMPVWDRETGEHRHARPSDVAILLRRLANVHLFEQALESRGIPYRTPSGAGFFTRQEVLDLTNLLGWLAEPDDAIALIGALRSPLFMLDDSTLLALSDAPGSWLLALRDPPASLTAELRARCRHAAAILDMLAEEAATAPAETLLDHALALTGFEAAWAPLQGGDQALANVRKFVTIARTLAGRSLDEVVDYLRRRRDELVAREGQAVLDDADAVRILTVHGAKGLEFPIVFLPEAHVESLTTYEAVRWRAEEGIALTLLREQDSDDSSRRRPGYYTHLLERDRHEEMAEHKRLLYVAATRAADALYISGDEAGRTTSWLALIDDAFEGGLPEGVEVRDPLPVDLGSVARRPAPLRVEVPPESEEHEVTAPLVARPRVIPLRASTPVTALRAPRSPSSSAAGAGDGLALLRGNLAHRAIELWFTSSVRPDLVTLARTLDPEATEPLMERVAHEVDAMLDRFDASPLAATLRDPETTAHFELPFAWHWDGVPVHGSIDLAYEREGAWHVIDFKTDDLHGRPPAEAGAPYLPQLALYAGALQEATGVRPSAGLLFLRTGERHVAPVADLDRALEATRTRIDAGALLEGEAATAIEDEL